jgi:hypothetical protein
MKIGYIAQLSPELRRPPYDGPANHIRSVVTGLGKLGHEVRLIAGLGDEIWSSSDLVEFKKVSSGASSAPSLFERAVRRAQSGLRLPYFNYFESRRFAQAIQQQFQGVDLLLERSSWMSYAGLLASRRMGVPLVIEYNGDPLHDLDAKGAAPRGLQRRISIRLLRNTLDNAAALVATGEGWRQNLIDRWKIDPARIVTMENGTPSSTGNSYLPSGMIFRLVPASPILRVSAWPTWGGSMPGTAR